jgi:hypothetical protein
MNTVKQDCSFIIALLFLLLVLVQPAGATPTPVIIYGPVVGLNTTGHTMTIEADCEKYSCQYNLTGRFEGLVPNDAVYSGIQEGEVVEAVFKEWVWKFTDPTGEYAVPSGGVKSIRQWYSVQRLAYGDNSTTFVGTEIFGDPGYLETPLDADYEISYRLFGPGPRTYDFKSFPSETVANTSVKRESGFNESKVFTTGETSVFSDNTDNTTISMQFIGGYTAEWAEAKACPCANFHIQVISDAEKKPVVIPGKTQAAQPGKSPVNPFTVITALAVSGFLCWVTVRK